MVIALERNVKIRIKKLTNIYPFSNNSTFFNYLIHKFPLEKLYRLFVLSRYFTFDVEIRFNGSGYCHSSPSGLYHEYVINHSILTEIRFSKYLLNSKRVETYPLTLDINMLRRKIYAILFSLKQYNIVKDMRVLIILKII